jgi:hypothetical protein
MEPLYFVEVEFPNRNRAFVETDRNTNSLASVVAGVAHGEWEKVVRVLEVREDECSCCDVTEEIALAALDLLESQSEQVPSFLRNFIDEQLFAGAADKHDARLSR